MEQNTECSYFGDWFKMLFRTRDRLYYYLILWLTPVPSGSVIKRKINKKLNYMK
jgi:hypothetical protein